MDELRGYWEDFKQGSLNLIPGRAAMVRAQALWQAGAHGMAIANGVGAFAEAGLFALTLKLPTPGVGGAAVVAGEALEGMATREVDPLLEFAEANRTKGSRFASEYTSPSGAKYYDVNVKGGRPNPFEGHHGGCSEVGCVLQADKAEGTAQGGSMRTIFNRPPNTDVPPGPPTGQGAPAEPCSNCQDMLEERGIHW
jgi:hypothetical protein